MGNALNAEWWVYPNKTLKPGTYTLIDSDRATWSQNSQSGGVGHFSIYGLPTSLGAKPPVGHVQEGYGVLAQFTLTRNAAISGYNRKHLSNVSPADCARLCISETSFFCKSFDYYKNLRQCDLSDKTAGEVGGLKTNYGGNPYNHYSR
jgi:hypothetical protein